MSREAFEAWVQADSTLPIDRDAHGYADMTTALMWHAWQAAQKANAPGGALVGESDANAGLGLAGPNSACAHDFALDHASSIRICQHCGRSELSARRKPANAEAQGPAPARTGDD
jgi:hypothetical protein